MNGEHEGLGGEILNGGYSALRLHDDRPFRMMRTPAAANRRLSSPPTSAVTLILSRCFLNALTTTLVKEPNRVHIQIDLAELMRAACGNVMRVMNLSMTIFHGEQARRLPLITIALAAYYIIPDIFYDITGIHLDKHSPWLYIALHGTFSAGNPPGVRGARKAIGMEAFQAISADETQKGNLHDYRESATHLPRRPSAATKGRCNW